VAALDANEDIYNYYNNKEKPAVFAMTSKLMSA